MEARRYWQPLDRAELPVLEWVERVRLGGLADDANALLTLAGEHGNVWYWLAGVAAACDKPRRKRWLKAAGAVAAIYGANAALKFATRRARPPIAAFGTEADLSFPSSHAVTSFAAARIYSRIAPGAAPCFYAGAAAVTGTRLHFCVHYPSDIVAGVVLGDVAGRVANALLFPAGDR